MRKAVSEMCEKDFMRIVFTIVAGGLLMYAFIGAHTDLKLALMDNTIHDKVSSSCEIFQPNRKATYSAWEASWRYN